MSEDPSSSTDTERVIHLLSAREGSRDADGGSLCPGPDLLVALAAGHLLPEETPGIEVHLLHCPDCRVVVRDLIEEAGHEEAEVSAPEPVIRGSLPFPERPARALILRRRLVAAAAVLAIGIAGLAVFLWESGGSLAPLPDTAGRLLQEARRLAEIDPAHFSGSEPFDLKALEDYPVDVLRSESGPALRHPASGASLIDGRPTLVWEAVPGADEHRVTVFGRGGRVLRSETVTGSDDRVQMLPWPEALDALLPGEEYQWEVSAKSPRGPVKSRNSFRLLPPEEFRRLSEAMREIQTRVESPLSDLLLAHHLLRHRVYGEAEAAARRYTAARPEDPLGRETLQLLLRLAGSSEKLPMNQKGK
jgi:hypothetical protein